MFWRVRRPHIDVDDEQWLIECWAWLNGVLGPIDGNPPRELHLPGRSAFPPTAETGHAKAKHYFDLVCNRMGLGERDYNLTAQPRRVDMSKIAPLGQFSSRGAAGTFSVRGNASHITYDPQVLNDPQDTIAVFAHELAHDLLLGAGSAPPGGPDMEEPATDLAAAHMGFGLFGANTAFEFKQFTDFDRQGWASSRRGYLTENHWGFAIALFMALRSIDHGVINGYLKSHLITVVRRARKHLDANPAVIARLRT